MSDDKKKREKNAIYALLVFIGICAVGAAFTGQGWLVVIGLLLFLFFAIRDL